MLIIRTEIDRQAIRLRKAQARLHMQTKGTPEYDEAREAYDVAHVDYSEACRKEREAAGLPPQMFKAG